MNPWERQTWAQVTFTQGRRRWWLHQSTGSHQGPGEREWSSGPSTSTETKGMQSVDVRSEKAPWFPHSVRASWGDSEVLRIHLTPFSLEPESCPWTPTPQFGPCYLLLIRSLRWYQPACTGLLLFMTDSYSNFIDNCHLLETSMSSPLWLTSIVTETSCDCVAWTGSLLGAVGPTLPKWQPRVVP